jgi:uncharacterized membrane protein YsdA (DUF1294 family)
MNIHLKHGLRYVSPPVFARSVINSFLEIALYALGAYLLVINIIAIVLMSIDKNIAKNPNRCSRVSEIGLLVPFLLGGFIGGYMGMLCCKSKRMSIIRY